MNAYIEILDTTNSVLGTLNVSDSSDFPLALQDKISDINDVLGGGTSSSSKTSRAPATAEINALLGYLYNSNISDDKDMKNIKPCRLIVDGVQYHNYNKIKFTDVIQKNGRPVEYEFVLYGENYEWVSALRETMLSDLDYYDGTTDVVTYSKAALNTVFPTTWDYGYDYWWSLKNYGDWKLGVYATVEDFRPDVYVRSIFEKGVEYINHTLVSDFVEGSIFKRLIYPFVGDGFNLSPEDQAANKIIVNSTSNQSNNNTPAVPISFPNETYDPTNLWVSNIFTAQREGDYKLTGIINFSVFVSSGNFIGGIVYYKNGG